MKPSDIGANESVAPGSSGPPPLKSLQRYGLAVLSVGVALGASLLLEHFHFRDAGFPLLLFAVAISSWYGGPRPAVLAVILSTVGFYWFFVAPVRTIYIYWPEVPYFIIFAAFAVLISWLSALRRRVEAALRQSHDVLQEQASLLNLTHDAVYVRDMKGVIRYWNRGAEVLYGWPSERALGKIAREFLKAVLPLPLEEIVAELLRTGRWEGELAKTHRDGTQLVVASRWSLKRDDQGEPVAILVTSNDITERKRAEEALRRSNRELRALSNCNQTLLRATDEQSLLQEMCRIVCEEAGYALAWVSYVEHDEAKSMRPVAWAGTDEAYLAKARISWSEDTARGRGPTGMAVRSGKSCCVQDFATDARVAPWRETLLQSGSGSAIALPLKGEDANVFGSLTIHSAPPNAFTPEEIHLLEELAGDLAFGIVTLRSRAARQRAEEALRQSEAHLSEAQRLSHTGSWAFDLASDRYIYLSEECLRIFELDAQGSLPTREAVSRLIHPEDWDSVNEGFEKSARDKVDTLSEFRIALPSGTAKHVQTIRHPVLNEAGDVVKMVGTVIDVTERKRAGEALRLSNAYNRSLIEASLDPLVTIGPDGKITDVNAATETATGCSRGELIGTDFCDYFTEPAQARAGYEQVFREGMVRDYPLELRHRSGRVMSVLYNASVYRDESGRVIGIFAAARDITERKRVEEDLQRSEAYLAEAERLSHTGTWAFDLASDKYVYTSEECRRIFELDVRKGLPNREAVSRHIHPEDWDTVKEDYENTLREKVDTLSDFRIVLPSGTTKHIQATRHPVLNDTGDVVKVVGTAVDITERKRSEEALRCSQAERGRAEIALHEARAELERISRMTTMGALTASIAHEVNQPLAGVVTSANAGLNWLAADPPNLSKTRESLERVRRDGTRAGEVLARIRGLLKRTPSAKTLVSVNQIVNEVLALAAGKLRGDNIETALALDASLPAVLGDSIQLQQVLLNLITNAIEAMAEVAKGPRTLRIQSSRGELEGKPAVVVAVSDTGIGLGSAEGARLFEAFHTTKPQGMGMGLWISRSIIEEHGGRLMAQANPGPGATFVLTIPAEQEVAV